MTINIYTAWISFLAGGLAGAVMGLFFHRAEWLGGYESWQRRLVRLAHISFFGIGFLNLAFGLTAKYFEVKTELEVPAYLLIISAVTMPLVCYLSAWRSSFRHLFFIPAGSVLIALLIFIWRIITCLIGNQKDPFQKQY